MQVASQLTNLDVLNHLNNSRSPASPDESTEQIKTDEGLPSNPESRLDRLDWPHHDLQSSYDSDDNELVICGPPERSGARSCTAAELVVGNLGPGVGTGSLLRLFGPYEPIAIRRARTAPGEPRYCHIYFKEEQDAVEAERRFDGLRLADHRLVVLRPATLIAQYEDL